MTSGIPFLDWALAAVSAFNTMVPIWLGFTILLNAEHRSRGVWLAGLGMLAAGAFFIFHSALLEGSIVQLPYRVRSVWYVGWLPVIALPFGWYLAMLWFGGYFDAAARRLRRRHRLPLAVDFVLGLAIAALFVGFGRPDVYPADDRLPFESMMIYFASPLPLYLYSAYILVTLLLALDVLRRIEPTGNRMSDIARERARPWLMATTALQLVVSVMVTCALAWLLAVSTTAHNTVDTLLPLSWLDLAIALLVSASVVLIGNAVVSYEIFTGKTLPRQGLRRHWHNALLLGAGFGIAMGAALYADLPPFWILLGTTLVSATFYALLNWRSYVGRERYLAHLRPFIGSQGLYERMLSAIGTDSPVDGVAAPFRALAGNVLGARSAWLVPLGPLASLAGPPLAFPEGMAVNLPTHTDIVHDVNRPGVLCVELEPVWYGGAVWGIPLWNERGLVGALLLGEKLDGGLYTQEEMEIARASGERLVDLLAAAEMARRLVLLQRRRMAESQVVDTRTRRVLHDDVLPRIHAAMLALSAKAENREAIDVMADLHRTISELLRQLPMPALPNLARLGIIGTLRSLTAGELRDRFDEVIWQVDPEAEEIFAKLDPLVSEVLYYAAREALRNAARYGRAEGRPHTVTIAATTDETLAITIADDGPGIDPARPSDGGSGQGLALHGTMMAIVGGALTIEGTTGTGTRVRLEAPRPASGDAPEPHA